ncbi:UNVERIFIED_CONTAM: hypothetical protein K2H54_044203 [Gekko kuhli]
MSQNVPEQGLIESQRTKRADGEKKSRKLRKAEFHMCQQVCTQGLCCHNLRAKACSLHSAGTYIQDQLLKQYQWNPSFY